MCKTQKETKPSHYFHCHCLTDLTHSHLPHEYKCSKLLSLPNMYGYKSPLLATNRRCVLYTHTHTTALFTSTLKMLRCLCGKRVVQWPGTVFMQASSTLFGRVHNSLTFYLQFYLSIVFSFFKWWVCFVKQKKASAATALNSLPWPKRGIIFLCWLLAWKGCNFTCGHTRTYTHTCRYTHRHVLYTQVYRKTFTQKHTDPCGHRHGRIRSLL